MTVGSRRRSGTYCCFARMYGVWRTVAEKEYDGWIIPVCCRVNRRPEPEPISHIGSLGFNSVTCLHELLPLIRFSTSSLPVCSPRHSIRGKFLVRNVAPVHPELRKDTCIQEQSAQATYEPAGVD